MTYCTVLLSFLNIPILYTTHEFFLSHKESMWVIIKKQFHFSKKDFLILLLVIYLLNFIGFICMHCGHVIFIMWHFLLLCPLHLVGFNVLIWNSISSKLICRIYLLAQIWICFSFRSNLSILKKSYCRRRCCHWKWAAELRKN